MYHDAPGKQMTSDILDREYNKGLPMSRVNQSTDDTWIMAEIEKDS